VKALKNQNNSEPSLSRRQFSRAFINTLRRIIFSSHTSRRLWVRRSSLSLTPPLEYNHRIVFPRPIQLAGKASNDFQSNFLLRLTAKFEAIIYCQRCLLPHLQNNKDLHKYMNFSLARTFLFTRFLSHFPQYPTTRIGAWNDTPTRAIYFGVAIRQHPKSSFAVKLRCWNS